MTQGALLLFLKNGLKNYPTMQRWATLSLRIVVGYGFIAHGIAKLVRGPEHFAEILHKLAVPLPHVAAWGTILVELIGGAFVLLGESIALVSVPLVGVLLVATFTVHVRYGFSSVKLKDVGPAGPVFGMPGYELNLLYIAALLALAVLGPGPFNLREVFAVLRKRADSRVSVGNAYFPESESESLSEDSSRSGSDSARAEVAIDIRPAIPADAGGIALRFIESATHHSGFDERYSTPEFAAIVARYRDGKQHPSADKGAGITLVAEFNRKIIGFVDARLEASCDPMHRDLRYCYIADIGVAPQHQNQGIGRRLLQAAENWGREQGADFASLEYHVANYRAGQLYQVRMSYRVVSMFAIKSLRP